MNVRDSEALSGLLRDTGYELLDSPEGADVVLFNTCSVRQHAEDKVWSELGRLRTKGPSLSLRINKPIIGLVGCMAQNYKEEIFKRAPVVDLVVGPNDLLSLPVFIKQIMKEKSQALAVNAMEREQDFYVSDFREDKNHAYVVISEGCSNFCSYCIVPFVRGRLRSRSVQSILDEAGRTIALGIKNITLLGQNVNSYKFKDINFMRLLTMVNSIEGLEQFSFLTSHPKDTSEELFYAMRDLKKCKKILHLPIQSGSDRILELMNRGYTQVHYRELADKYRKIVNGKLSTDIIAGFPTETNEDFKETLKLLKDIEFDSAYIFKYSRRPHTKAESLPDDVSKQEKERRHKILLDLQREISGRKRCKKE